MRAAKMGDRETMRVSSGTAKQIVFVCQHGAFRSRIAAACFNAAAPPGWSAISAGITPQSEVSTRIDPLLAGSRAAAFVDRAPPRSLDSTSAARVIAIDATVPGAETWSTDELADGSDERLRDEIRDRVRELIGEL
jgi:hypothetical protein